MQSIESYNLPKNSLIKGFEIEQSDGKPLNIKAAVSELAITAREKQVLILMVNGLNNFEIAEHLNISAHTVKNHITNIYKKLKVTDRFQAMRIVLNI